MAEAFTDSPMMMEVQFPSGMKLSDLKIDTNRKMDPTAVRRRGGPAGASGSGTDCGTSPQTSALLLIMRQSSKRL